MAESMHTIDRIRDVILRHIDQATLRKVLEDLRAVEGSESFKETIRLLRQSLT